MHLFYFSWYRKYAREDNEPQALEHDAQTAQKGLWEAANPVFAVGVAEAALERVLCPRSPCPSPCASAVLLL